MLDLFGVIRSEILACLFQAEYASPVQCWPTYVLAFLFTGIACPVVPLVIVPLESIKGDVTYDLYGLEISVRELLVSTFRANPTISVANITYS